MSAVTCALPGKGRRDACGMIQNHVWERAFECETGLPKNSQDIILMLWAALNTLCVSDHSSDSPTPK